MAIQSGTVGNGDIVFDVLTHTHILSTYAMHAK